MKGEMISCVNSKLIPCICQHTGADKWWGKGIRLHNRTQQNNALLSKWRCVVCLNEK